MAVDVKAVGMPTSMPWIDRLLRMDTTSRNSNLGLIETVRDELQKLGLKPWLTHNAERTKANLFATLPAADGSIDGGVVLSGHTDVVPVDGQDWATDPFVPEIKDGKLYARGSADMKSFIAIALTQAEKAVHMPLTSPLHLALSFDEEIGCVGAPLMIDELSAHGIRPQGCIVGEPTSMEVVVAHKGINAYRCKIHGRSAHSSLPDLGVNAIEYAARLICFIRDIADELRQGPYDDAFDTPFSTAQTGLIKGGAALNLVPENCEFEFEFRNLPALDSAVLIDRIQQYANDVLLPKMKGEHEEAGIRFEKIAKAPGLNASEQDAITKLVRDLARDNGVRKVAYGTEAGQFQAAGVPAIICGPGDIRQAHRPNEFIAIEQIERCESFLESLVGTMVRK